MLKEALIANKLLGGSGGGGGSSDFSTANITIVPIIEGSPTLVRYGVEANNPDMGYPSISFLIVDESPVIPVPIYTSFASSGFPVWMLTAEDGDDNPYFTESLADAQIEGDAVYDSDIGGVMVRGDCTITVEMIFD